MKHDRFSKYHPLTNFLFFVGAIGFGVLIQHPAYILAGLITGSIYYLLLTDKKGMKLLAAMVPLFLLLTFINPLFNTRGDTELWKVFGRPYTLEALFYGGAVAGIFVNMLIWFGCYNKVLTSDKFTSLFGSLIPSISLLLIMVLRMVPNLMRKATQIAGARKSVGKGLADSATMKEKILGGGAILGALTGWALEGGIITGDSMRARGYGSAKRTSFMIYRFTGSDLVVLGALLLLAATTIGFSLAGSTAAEYTPTMVIAPVTAKTLPGLIAYSLYLLIPTILRGKEALQWHISISKI